MMSQPAPLASASDHHGLEQVSIINWNCCPSSIGFGVHFHRNKHRKEDGSLFPGFFGSSLRKIHRDLITPGSGVSGVRYTLSFRCVMQDYEFHDQWPFIAWLAPYIETGGWFFFYTNHTDFLNDGPKLFYFQDQKVKFFDVDLTQTGSADQSGASWDHLDDD